MAGGAIRAGQAFVEFYADNTRLVRGMKTAEKRLRRFGAATRNVGARMLGVSAAAAVPIARSVQVFSSFEEQMSAVKAITGATGQNFQQLTKLAQKLGATTQFTAAEAAQGMQFLGMAGFDTQQIMAGLPATLDLAKAGAVELGLAADIASDVSSAFGLAAGEIGRVADVMATTATSANTNIELMGESFKYSAPLAAAVGQSIEDTAAAIGVLGNNAIKGSSAGTDLANIFKNLAAKQSNLKGFGTEVSDSEGNFRRLTDILKDLNKGMAGLGEAEKLDELTTIFGGRAVKSAVILMKNVEAVEELQTKLEGAQGAASKMAATMADNLAGSAKSLWSALEGVQIQIGQALGPTLRQLTEIVIGVTRGFGNWVAENPGVVQAVAAGIAGFAALGTALITAGASIAAIGAGLAALTNPMTIIAAGLVAGAALWAQYAESGEFAIGRLKQLFGDLGETVTAGFGGITDAMKAGNLELAGDILATTLRLIALQAKDAFMDVWDELGREMLAKSIDWGEKLARNATVFGALGLWKRGEAEQKAINAAQNLIRDSDSRSNDLRETDIADLQQKLEVMGNQASLENNVNDFVGFTKSMGGALAEKINFGSLFGGGQADAVPVKPEGAPSAAGFQMPDMLKELISKAPSAAMDFGESVAEQAKAAAAGLMDTVGFDADAIGDSMAARDSSAVGVRGVFNTAAAQSLLGGQGVTPLEKKADKQIEALEAIKKSNDKIAAKTDGLIFTTGIA